MHKYLLPRGFVVHVDGIPVEIQESTLVHTATELPIAKEQHDLLVAQLEGAKRHQAWREKAG